MWFLSTAWERLIGFVNHYSSMGQKLIPLPLDLNHTRSFSPAQPCHKSCTLNFKLKTVKMLELNFIRTLYKFEMIFLLLFSYSMKYLSHRFTVIQIWDDFFLLFSYLMKYLSIYLPYKTRIEGTIHYRYMYTFGRLEITHAMQLKIYFHSFL